MHQIIFSLVCLFMRLLLLLLLLLVVSVWVVLFDLFWWCCFVSSFCLIWFAVFYCLWFGLVTFITWTIWFLRLFHPRCWYLSRGVVWYTYANSYSTYGSILMCSGLRSLSRSSKYSIFLLQRKGKTIVYLVLRSTCVIRAKRVSNCYMREKRNLTVCVDVCVDVRLILVLVCKNCLGFSVGYQRAPGWF